jgi:hypothetical protein
MQEEGSDSAGSLKDFIADNTTEDSDSSSSDGGGASKRTTRNDVGNGKYISKRNQSIS